jgi:hypothetical protein
LSTQGVARPAEIHSFPARYRKRGAGAQTSNFSGASPFRIAPETQFRGSQGHLWSINYRKKSENIQNSLISLHFSNPELHNNLLASQHPNMG